MSRGGEAPRLGESTPSAWLSARSGAALDEARRHVEAHARGPAQAETLTRALELSVCGRHPRSYCAPVHLPLLVHAAITGDDGPALPLAAAMALLWAGAELYDNVMDDELPPELAGGTGPGITMTSFALLTVLPHAIVAQLEVSAERRVRMQGQLARGILAMFDGQEQDGALANRSEVSPDEVEASVLGKNGAAKGLFTGLAAEMAAGKTELTGAYREFGQCLGVVYQLQSDAHEMFRDAWCRDLATGTRTLQIALRLEQLRGAEREAFLEALDAARTDADAQARVRSELRRTDAIRPWLATVRRYAVDAEAALDRAAPVEPAGSILRDLVRMRSPGCQGWY